MNVKNLSSNALYAKSKAMFAQRITDSQYADMASLPDIKELSTYLKNTDGFRDAFESMDAVHINRTRLEAIIKRSVFIKRQKLIKYANISDNKIEDYFRIKTRVDVIVSCLRNLGDAYRVEPYLLYLPIQTVQSLGFDLEKLANAKDTREFLEALTGTEYEKLLSKLLFETKSGFVHAEVMLLRYHLEKSAKLIADKNRKANSKPVLDLLSLFSDISTISELYRVKNNYDNNEKMLLHVFRSNVGKIDDKTFGKLCQLDNRQFEEEIYKSAYGKYFKGVFCDGNLVTKVLFDVCSKTMAKSVNMTECALCCDKLFEIEKANICMIAEAISYGIDKEQIMSMLVKEK